jgi:hypothetical protein
MLLGLQFYLNKINDSSGLSTMAAAALGNAISDVAGVTFSLILFN